MKLTDEEKAILDSVERGEWQPVHGLSKEKRRYETAARAIQIKSLPPERSAGYGTE